MVSIGGRTITNRRLADDIDRLAGKEEELVQLVGKLDSPSSGEKTKIMTNNKTGFQKQVKIGGAT